MEQKNDKIILRIMHCIYVGVRFCASLIKNIYAWIGTTECVLFVVGTKSNGNERKASLNWI